MSAEAPQAVSPDYSRGRNIVLFGMSGVGKTTVGEETARRLGMTHIDLDAVLQKRMGMDIGQIVEKDGWPHMRALESHLIKSLNLQGHVISTGGGVVLNPENTANLLVNGAGGVGILLEAPVEVLHKRTQAKKDPNRPLGDTDEEALKILTERAEDRKELYPGPADFGISNATDDSTEVVDAIVCAVTKGKILEEKEIVTL